MYVHYVQKLRLRTLGATDQKFTILYTHKLDDIPSYCILKLAMLLRFVNIFI